jgi:hypothetical protein
MQVHILTIISVFHRVLLLHLVGHQATIFVDIIDTDLRHLRHRTWTGMIHTGTHRVADLLHPHLSNWYPHVRIRGQACHAWLRRESIHGDTHHTIRHRLRSTGTWLLRIGHG